MAWVMASVAEPVNTTCSRVAPASFATLARASSICGPQGTAVAMDGGRIADQIERRNDRVARFGEKRRGRIMVKICDAAAHQNTFGRGSPRHVASNFLNFRALVL